MCDGTAILAGKIEIFADKAVITAKNDSIIASNRPIGLESAPYSRTTLFPIRHTAELASKRFKEPA